MVFVENASIFDELGWFLLLSSPAVSQLSSSPPGPLLQAKGAALGGKLQSK